MPKELYETINIYEQTVEELSQPLEEPESLSALVLGVGSVDTKKGKRKLVKLLDGHEYGFLTLHKEIRERGPGGFMRYECKCKCGSKVMLTRKEISERVKFETGCLGVRCPFGPDELKAWHNPDFALWLQLTTLLKACPESVDNRWGGTAYEGMGKVKVGEGYAALLSDVTPMVDILNKRWWLSRRNPVLPYSPFNIEMSDTPDFDVLGQPLNYVVHGGTLYSLAELANMFDVSLIDIRNWRKHYSDKKVMQRIMTEANQ